MVLHDVNKAWDTLTDNEKRRIFAIWCTQPPPTIDWKTLAAALGSSSSEANRVAHFNALKKLRTAGAVIEGNGTPSASAATTPTPTPKKPRAKKGKADGDDAGGDDATPKPTPTPKKPRLKKEKEGREDAGSNDATPKPKATPKKPRGTKRKAEDDGSGDESGGDGEAPTTPVRKVIKKAVTPTKKEMEVDNEG
ncbi:hypothetical protein W97_03084 [Coniosporium apollinis CBS 100218]|uniref:Myb-like domain-containing protein n=1 Tax=Coniosporium apollinis (strain CBS 100218) TaxID=1168221 RepID=R7YQA7_CONA1|nr:uncharacterized protein W97_03084 [Coniosporium apollinis CBS 100218]EON63856.1 hypothetical protein W97_03084 [Coniosporium apollinis CBS 100218]